jgi:hypothetical protein
MPREARPGKFSCLRNQHLVLRAGCQHEIFTHPLTRRTTVTIDRFQPQYKPTSAAKASPCLHPIKSPLHHSSKHQSIPDLQNPKKQPTIDHLNLPEYLLQLSVIRNQTIPTSIKIPTMMTFSSFQSASAIKTLVHSHLVQLHHKNQTVGESFFGKMNIKNYSNGSSTILQRT